MVRAHETVNVGLNNVMCMRMIERPLERETKKISTSCFFVPIPITALPPNVRSFHKNHIVVRVSLSFEAQHARRVLHRQHEKLVAVAQLAHPPEPSVS